MPRQSSRSTRASSHSSDKAAFILLVHPNPLVCDAYQALLEKEGYQVGLASDGIEAIAKIYKQMPDLVIADTAIADLNGYQLCRLMKNDPTVHHIPFVLVSHVEDKIDRFWGFQSGADGFIPDPLASDAPSGKRLGGKEKALKPSKAAKALMLSEVNTLLEMYRKKKALSLLPSREQTQPYNVRTRLNQIMDKLLVESTLMNEFRSLTDFVFEKNLLNHMLLSLLENVIDYDVAGVVFYEGPRVPVTVFFHVAEGRSCSQEELQRLHKQFVQFLKNEQPTFPLVEETTWEQLGEAPLAGEDNPKIVKPNLCCKTLFHHAFFESDQLLGAIGFYHHNTVDYAQIFPVSLVLHELRLLMKMRQLYAQAELAGITDGLTGLLNYKHFMALLEREFRRSKRYGLSLSLIGVDIDQFQVLNTTHGHEVGNALLRHLGTLMLETFRNSDLIARQGAEEFILLLPETTLKQASTVCKRLQKTLEKTPLSYNGTPVAMSVSIGVVMLDDTIASATEFVQAATQAMVLAKKQGQNQIELVYPE